MFSLTHFTKTPDNTFKKYIPILTIICCLTTIILFIGINSEENINSWEAYAKWGSLPSTDILNGSLWALITSNFLHKEIWHIAFNLYWFWFFGKKIEFETNKIYFAIIILSSALVSSISQIGFSDSTGIGLSGICYSFFGFIIIKSQFTEEYKNYIDKKTIYFFVFWLIFCIILTQSKIWIVGNAAHISGFLWGMLLAYISKFNYFKQYAISLLLFSGLTSLIFWNPYSTTWLSHKAFELHKDQKIDEAIEVYKNILEIDSNNEFASNNLNQLRIHKLSEKAFKLHENHKYREAEEIYYKILSIDKDNEWAKSNLKILPKQQ